MGLLVAATVDTKRLERDLKAAVAGEVRFDAASRALYASDASNYRQVPIGVVVPRSVEDIIAVHDISRRLGAPLLARGCGTSLSGETVNVAVVIDCSKYLHAIRFIDADRRLAACQPGVINDQLNTAAAEHGLVFAPDPSTHAYCTIGGNIGNNSCGTHSVLGQFCGDGGRTSDNVHKLEVLTYGGLRLRVGETSETELDALVAGGGRRGDIYRRLRELRDRYGSLIRERFPDIPRRVSGYNLDELLPERGFNVARALVGTEGTCVTVLDAVVKLLPRPRARVLLVAGYEDVFLAADDVALVMDHRPDACEGFDDLLVADQRDQGMNSTELERLPDGHGWLLVEFGDDSIGEASARARALLAELKGSARDVRVFEQLDEQEGMWRVREAGLAATAFPPGEAAHWPGWEDSAVSPVRVGAYLRDLRALYDQHGYGGSFYGHFGQGCIHSRIDFNFASVEGRRRYRAFMEEAADLVISYGGSLSGEHGDGQQRAELLPRMFGAELVEAFREFKAIWDPDGRMNPGKIVDPAPLDSALRLAASPVRSEAPQAAHFSQYDRDGFALATRRCVGVGKCRRPGNDGTMCPSFQVLREEKHTTRGRARLMFEMLQGDVVTGGWRDQDVYDALHLCLSCKGCTNECPVNVDIPTMKAEFLSHYYRGRVRPRAAYAMGLIMLWARGAALSPGTANLVSQVAPLSTGLKAAAGVSPSRQLPPFARTTFRRWFRARPVTNVGCPQVLLWPDTFNDHFNPETAIACTQVLEAAGYQVTVPGRWLCCGRPLYDFGFLDLARRFLQRIIDEIRPQIRAGIPVIGVEPSCLAVFRDELPKLLADDPDATRLTQQSFHLSEFLDLHRDDWHPPRLERRALVHGHCHHKNGPGGFAAEPRLLERMGLTCELPESGCCGMAGSFGFERGDRHDLSVRCGERVLLPEVRAAAKDTLIIADGFSCKEQIRQLTDRQALHTGQVIAMALRNGTAGRRGDYPERDDPPMAASWRQPLVALGSGLAAAAIAARWTR
jgi:FAD/FMN-containing dehydrogenase/Fe-S oxidoreductase